MFNVVIPSTRDNLCRFWKILLVSLFCAFFLSVQNTEAALGIDNDITQVKYPNSPVIYYLNHAQKTKKAYINKGVFLSYGNKWSDIKTILPSYLDKWTEANVVKTKDDSGVFEIRNGNKRKIKSEEEFLRLGYKWGQIMEVSTFDLGQYKDVDINETVNSYVHIAKSVTADDKKTSINISKNEKKIANSSVVPKTVSLTIPVSNTVKQTKTDKINDTKKIVFYWPVKGHINYKFHDQNYLYDYEHQGIDIAANQGTNVRASQSGTVVAAINGGLTGYSYVTIDHGNGYKTVYGHLSQIDVVVGQKVNVSVIIGKSGGTPGTSGAGQYSNGPHLHFELIKDGKYIDPELYL